MSTEEKLESEKKTGEQADDVEPSELVDGSEPSELAGSSSEEAGGAGKRTIGLERWVQLGFVAAAILLVWLYDHLINAVWYAFADPDEALATAGAIVAGFATTIVLYKNAAVYGMVHGVAEELSRVTWPTRKETSSSTVVVVITSVIAALVLFLFDSVWSAVTDLVYKV